MAELNAYNFQYKEAHNITEDSSETDSVEGESTN